MAMAEAGSSGEDRIIETIQENTPSELKLLTVDALSSCAISGGEVTTCM